MAFRLYILIFFLTVNLFSSNFNEIIRVDENTKSLEILSKSEIFIDKSQDLTYEEVKNYQFKKNSLKTLSYGYSPDFRVWIKVTLTNTTSKPLTKYIQYSNAISTNINLFYDDKVFNDGLFNLNSKRVGYYPNFEIPLKANETKEIYIQAYSDITTLIVKLDLLDKETLTVETHKKDIVYVILFTALTILILYNFLIYFFTKNRSYIFYVLYVVGLMYHHMIYTGFGTIYLLSQEVVLYSVKLSALLVTFPLFFFALLIQSFIGNLKGTYWYKIINYYLIFIVVTTIVFLFVEEFERLRHIPSFTLVIYLLILTTYSLIKKVINAYLIFLGWSVVTLAFVLMYLSSAGIFEVYEYFPYIVESCFLFEGIIFSIALANKIKQLEKEKESAHRTLLETKLHENERLEKTVKEKTIELKTSLNEKELLLQELNHRVKNNMQMVVSLIRLQSDSTKDVETKKILEIIQNRIYAMGSLHELLYKQSDISNINSEEYFSVLVEEIRKTKEKTKISIDYSVSTLLKSEDAIYCGLIINELVTNAFKHAFDESGGKISIVLKKVDNQYNLIVEDSGNLNNKQIKENLGFLLIRTVAKSQLKGQVKIDTSEGMRVEVSWK